MTRDEKLLAHADEVGELMRVGKYAECIKRMHSHIANETDPIILGNCHSTIANCLCNLGDIVGARQSFTTAESYRTPETLDSPHGDLGEVRLLLAEGNFAKAQEILLRNLSSNEIHLDFFRDAYHEMLQQMGETLVGMERFEQALPYFQEAANCYKHLPESADRDFFLCDCLVAVGFCLLELNRYDEVMTILPEIMRCGSPHHVSDALYYLGTAQLRNGQPVDAIKTLKEAETHALGDTARYKMVLMAESDAYRAAGAIEVAEALLKRADAEPEIQ